MRSKRIARQLKSAWIGYRASDTEQLLSSLRVERERLERTLLEEREYFTTEVERRQQLDAELKQRLATALAVERRWIERTGIHG